MKRSKTPHADREILPTGERLRHAIIAGGTIIRAEPERFDRRSGSKQFLDADGRPGSPLKVVDTLDTMLRMGTITDAQHLAGRRFRDDYEIAGLAGVRASPIERTGSTGMPSTTIADVRLHAARQVDRAIRALGICTPAQRCAVTVVAEGCSLNAWREHERIRRTTAASILREVLECLCEVYG